MLVSAHRLFHPDNNSRTLLLSSVDATERRQHEAEKDVLLGELRHRMKNLLGLVQAIARQRNTATLSSAGSMRSCRPTKRLTRTRARLTFRRCLNERFSPIQQVRPGFSSNRGRPYHSHRNKS